MPASTNVAAEMAARLAAAIRSRIPLPPAHRGRSRQRLNCRAVLTAAISSLIATLPLRLRSNDGQFSTGAFPSAMLTPLISSLIATPPSPLQSPTHAGSVAVAEAVAVPLAMLVAVGVLVEVGVVRGRAVEPLATSAIRQSQAALWRRCPALPIRWKTSPLFETEVKASYFERRLPVEEVDDLEVER